MRLKYVNGDSFLDLDNPKISYGANNPTVQRWLLGHTDEWLQLKAEYDAAVVEHDNWVAIQSYDADMATYQTALDAYNTWEFTEETPTKPELPTAPAKPEGYYTQEEVDASQAKWDEWKVGYDAFVPDEFNTTYSVPEPEVLKLPINVPEPTIPALPDPVPNTPEPEFTAEELAAQAYAQSRVERTQAVENIVVTTAAGNSFDGDEVAQGRMARAILSLPNDTTTISWKQSDNTFANVTRVELGEALALAGAEQAALWVQYG